MKNTGNIKLNPNPPIEDSSEYKFSGYFLLITILICIVPFILNLFGIYFSSHQYDFSSSTLDSPKLSKDDLQEEMFHALSGSLQHGLLEWSAVIAALLTSILAFAHFSIRKDITTPIIGITLFCSAIMDTFHTLAALRLVSAVADNSNFIPFTWALSRSFHSILMFFGVIVCLKIKNHKLNWGLRHIFSLAIFISLIACVLMYFTANSPQLPQTQYTDTWFSRPFDIIPLFIFLISVPLFWFLYLKMPSLLTASLLFALIPEIILETHMAFGSEVLFDNHFNIAHFLKIVAYLIPFFGFVGDYLNEFHMQAKTKSKLEERECRLQAIMDYSIEGIILTNNYGFIESANQACSKIFGYETKELLGLNMIKLIPGLNNNNYISNNQISETIWNANTVGLEQEMLGSRKKGDSFPVALSVSQFTLDQQQYFSLIVRDFTEKKKIENELLHRIKIAELNSDIGFIVNHEAEMDYMLQRCTETIVYHLDAAFARIWLLDKESNVLLLKASAGMYTHLNGEHSQIPVGKYKIGYIAEQQTPHLTNQVIGDTRVSNQEWAKQEGMVSFAGYPIVLGNELLGVVALFAKFPLNDLTIQSLESVTHLLAIGMHRILADEELRRLNTDLVKQSESLQRSNEDLQSFAYSASHDLQEPIRSVSNYLSLLTKKYGDQLDPNVMRYITNSIDSTTRMKTLIQDLLEYSRISTSEFELEMVNLSKVMEYVSGNLNLLIEETSTSIEYTNLPDVNGDFSQLVKLFQNIIQNAIKYKSTSDPVIKISAENNHDMIRISIADNGIGIKPEYRTRIFEIFKRLHTREEYSGNGVGLSLCKKIVERHQGTIWCESEVEQGSTFYITLPKHTDS